MHEIVVYNVYKKNIFYCISTLSNDFGGLPMRKILKSAPGHELWLESFRSSECCFHFAVFGDLPNKDCWNIYFMNTMLFCFFFHKQRYLIVYFIEFLSKQFVNIKLNYLFLQIKSRINLINQP